MCACVCTCTNWKENEQFSNIANKQQQKDLSLFGVRVIDPYKS